MHKAMNRQEATTGHFRYKKCVYFMIPVLLYSVAVLALVAVYALAQGPDAGNVSTPFGETYPSRAFRAGHYLVAGVSFGCGMVACLLLENRGEGGHPLCFIVAVAVQTGVVAAVATILYPPVVSLPTHVLLIFQSLLFVITKRESRSPNTELRTPLRPRGLPSVPEGTAI